MIPVNDLVDLLLSQDGDEYVFGAEASLDDADPDAFDCSELIEWACGRLGVSPRMPDGSWYQARHAKKHGMLIPIEEAINTKGALLYRFSSSPFASTRRPKSAHVAVSLGDGKTIEARSSRHGVGVFSAEGRGWTHASLVAGVDYDTVVSAPESSLPTRPVWTASDLDGLIRVNDDGFAVRRVQANLLANGVRITVDGQFGPNTDASVRAWQERYGLVVDGIVGPVTWRSVWGHDGTVS